MNVLVFNCGSSSLKYRLLAMPAGEELAGGEAQRVGPPTAEPSRIVHRRDGAEEIVQVPLGDHAAACGEVMALLTRRAAPDALAHRVVHGGDRFSGPTRLTATAIADLTALNHLAPLHNPPATALIAACADRYPELPQVAVFDTAFHATIPPPARTYALAPELARPLGLRRYGFHGTSHAFVAAEAARFLGLEPRRLTAVSCHLGSGGASLCAIDRGRSVANTFGYSPTPGLMMSTRCGDLDPAVVMTLLADRQGDGAAVDALLNKRSGVLGASGRSADIRDLLAESGEPHPVVALYVWRIRKYLGAYLALLGRPDAVIFTDTIGETVPAIRAQVCAGLDAFGITLDPARNAAADPLPMDIAAAGTPVRLLAIATNEELAIARQAAELLDPDCRHAVA